MEIGSGMYFFGSIAVAIAALMTAVIAWRKFKPETTSIQVTSADTVVEMTIKSAQIIQEERNDLRLQVRELRSTLEEFRERVEASEDRADLAERRAAQAEKRAETSETRVEVLTRENHRLRKRIAHLEQEVESIKKGPEHNG